SGSEQAVPDSVEIEHEVPRNRLGDGGAVPGDVGAAWLPVALPRSALEPCPHRVKKKVESRRMQIALQRVTKRFGAHVVLDSVNLTIASGQTVAMIGPSGGGKSTLIRCLNGLNTFDDGEICVD